VRRLLAAVVPLVAVLVLHAASTLAEASSPRYGGKVDRKAGETCERTSHGIGCFQVVDESCSEAVVVASGTCIAVLQSRDGVFLEGRNRSSGGRIEVCVISPSKTKECRHPVLRLSQSTGEYLIRFRYAKLFDAGERGRYAVSWFGWSLGTKAQIDRTLHFQLGE
jgi:hypothetical protein